MNIDEKFQLAFESYKEGNLLKAENICREILDVQPNNMDALYFLAEICYSSQKYDLAIEYIKNVLQYNPANAEAYNNLGLIYQEKEQFNEAVEYYEKALQLNPNLPDSYLNLGFVLQKTGRIDEGIIYYKKALKFNPNDTNVYYNLGIAFQEKGQLGEAIQYYQKALELNPNDADIYCNLGFALQENRQPDEAIKYYQKALQLNPHHATAHLNMALALLLTGNFRDGWRQYEWRWQTYLASSKRNFSQPLWDGSDIKGRTILLYDEAGFGDYIQFIRYAPLVAQYGGKIVFECHKELTSLLQSAEGIQEIVGRGEELPKFDVHCPLSSLPLIFDTTLESIPAKIPYICVESKLIQKWKNKVQHDEFKTKIGLVWAGRSISSCSLETFSLIARIDNITFYSLQKGEAEKQAKNPPKGMSVIDLTEDINDFSDTAALIENLDLVITIDTAVAHLAGALGKPVWTLLPFMPDWRWMLNRDTSPWYPTMRLFRQSSPGDWKPVIANVADELEKIIKSKRDT